MEYKIGKTEFENSQKMFNYIIGTFGSRGHDSIELRPFSNEGDYLVFFDEANVIKQREQWEKYYMEVELTIKDDEGNRININSLSDLLGLEGVDSTGIIVREFNHYIENGN